MKHIFVFLGRKSRVFLLSPRYVHIGGYAAILAVVLVASALSLWPTEARSAQSEVARAWENVRRAGSYRFTADIRQVTAPVAGVRNIGRTAKSQDIVLKGAADLKNQGMEMTLWSQGGSVLDRASGLQVKMEDGRVLARQDEGTWREIEDFSATIAPQGDFLAFLDSARDIVYAGQESRSGQTFTRYTFRVDGRAFAERARDRWQRQLQESGMLPPAAQLAIPEVLAGMTGSGELWVDRDALPRRLKVNLSFSEENGVEARSNIDVTFADFGRRSGVPTIALVDPGVWVSSAQKIAPYVLAILLFGLFSFFLTHHARSRVVYNAVAIFAITSFVAGPLLSGVNARQQSRRFRDFQARQAALRAQAETASATRQEQTPSWRAALARTDAQALTQIRSDNGRDSDADGLTDVQEVFLGSDPLTADDLPASAAFALPPARDLRQLANQDSDGDGLNDYEETLLGTALDDPDTDGDLISDLQEIQGFEWPLGSGKMWHTDPLSLDTNSDGIGDADEWNSSKRSHATWDTDNDGVPDLFDRDNDGDGVPDHLDISPFQALDATFSSQNPFNLTIQGLTPDKPTFVRFQLRPTNPDHLWYALNRLDWPQDDGGNIKDTDNTSDDLRLIPMLEITIPAAPSNLPRTTPKITVNMRGSAKLPSMFDNAYQPISGTITLTQDGPNIAVDPKLNAQTFLVIREGTCASPKIDASNAITVFMSSNGTGATDVFQNLQLKDRASGGYVITAVHQPQGRPIFLGCGQIPHTPFEGDRMIDQAALQPYGVNVREGKKVGDVEKRVYVPLNLVTDDPANLTGKPELPAVEGGRGARVAFQGVMPYFPRESWKAPHQVRLVWTVRMNMDDVCVASNLVDGPDPNGPLVFDCIEEVDNAPQVIHTYDDEWRLTGLDVQEERGASMATVFEDPGVDPDPNNDVPLLALATGLSDTFLSGRQVNGRRDMTVAEIARRFDRSGNASVSLTERWGIENILSVATNAYPSLDAMMRDSIERSQQILDANFTSKWSESQRINPLFLYAYEWQVRELNLAVKGKDKAVTWDKEKRQLTLDFGGNASPLKTIAGLKIQSYRYDKSAGRWRHNQTDELWRILSERYAAFATPNVDPEMGGRLAFLQLVYFALGNGLQQTVQIADQPIALLALADSDIGGKFGQATNARLAITWVTDALLDPVLSGTRTTKVLKYLYTALIQNKVVDPAQNLVERAVKIMSFKAFNRLLYTATALAAVLIVGQLTLLLTSAFANLDEAAAKGINIALQVISAVSIVFFTSSAIVTGLNTTKKAGETITKLGLISKLSSVKAAIALAVIGLVIQLVIIWGIFLDGLINGKFDTSAQLHTALAASLANTIVAVLYTAIAVIPIIGPIIVAILAFIDAILTIICEAGVDALRGVVTEGSDACFTLAGGLAEWLAGLWVATDIIFDFNSDSTVVQKIPEQQRFPSLNDFQMDLSAPEMGLVQNNVLTFKAKVGGKLAPSLPKQFNATDAYEQNNIRRTGIVAEFSTASNDGLTAQKDALSDDPGWKFIDVPVTLKDSWDSNWEKSYTAYIAAPPELPVSTQPITLTQAGVNADYMLPIHLNIGMAIPLYSCFITACETGNDDDFQDVSFTNPVLESPQFVLDVLPATLDAFYKRDWGTFTDASGQRRGVPFPTPSDFDGDGLRSQTFGGLDVDDSKPDSDGDGLPDGYEADLRQLGVKGIDPTQIDSDNDGLCDFYEIQIGTRPDRKDTDFDGLADGEEVWHPDCATGAWTGGWLFTYDATNNLTTRVTSDPLRRDTDLDGLSDELEKRLHQKNPDLYPYHPGAPNTAPLAFSYQTNDQDNIFLPGDAFVYTATLTNNLVTNLYAQGIFTREFPAGLGDFTHSNKVTLYRNDAASFTATLTTGADSQLLHIRNIVSANVTDSAQAVNAGPSDIFYEEKVPIIIDADAPSSSLTGGLYVQAGNIHTIGGLAEDPTSYIERVEVLVPGQNAFIKASGAEAWAYNWAVPQTEGRYTIQSRAIDAVGHKETPPHSADVIVDATPPTLTTNQSGDPILLAKRDERSRWTLNLDGGVNDPPIGSDPGSGVAWVEVKIEPFGHGWQPAVIEGAKWSVQYPLAISGNGTSLGDPTGQYTVTVRTADKVDNRTSPSNHLVFRVRVDNTPPIASLDSLSARTQIGAGVSITTTSVITRGLTLTGTISDPGAYSAGLGGLEIAFTPLELQPALATPTLALFLNEPEGVNVYQDASGNGRNGSCQDTACPLNDSDGIYGSAVRFDGVDDMITIDADIPEENVSISLWFNTAQLEGGLFSATAGDPNAAAHDRALYLVDGNVCAFVQGDVKEEICTAGANYADGQWHQVVLALDDAAPFRLYVDGASAATAGVTTASKLSSQSRVTLGFSRDRDNRARYLAGRIDEVEIHPSPLSEDAIATLFRRWQPVTLAQSGPNVSATTWSFPLPNDLQGYYQIDIRGEDALGNRNDERRAAWRQWRGIIDVTPPQIHFTMQYLGLGKTSQTRYEIVAEDFALSAKGYSGPCAIDQAQSTPAASPPGAKTDIFGTRTSIMRLSCTVNGHARPGQTVTFCDVFGNCAFTTEERTMIYFARTSLDGSDLSEIYRANLNLGVQFEKLLGDRAKITGLDVDETRGHLYWLERRSETNIAIIRSDLDGRNVTSLLSITSLDLASAPSVPITLDLIVDPLGGKMYWSQGSEVYWANLDGSDASKLFAFTPSSLQVGRLVLDRARGLIYAAVSDTQWNAPRNSQIWVFTADGAQPRLVVDETHLQDAYVPDLALSADGARLYWARRGYTPDANVDGFYSLDLNGGAAPVRLGDANNSLAHFSILELGPVETYVYWSYGNIIHQGDLTNNGQWLAAVTKANGKCCIRASAIALIPGVQTNETDLELTLSADSEVALVGGPVTYELLVRNRGPVDAVDLVIESALPANTTFIPAGSSAQCTPSSPGVVRCTRERLDDAATWRVTIQAQVEPGATGNLVYAATLTAHTPDSDPSNNAVTSDAVAAYSPPTPTPNTARYLYWGSENEIVRHLVDAPESLEVVYSASVLGYNATVTDLVNDWMNEELYWIVHDGNEARLQKGDYAGSSVETLATFPLPQGQGVRPQYLAIAVNADAIFIGYVDMFNGTGEIRVFDLLTNQESSLFTGIHPPVSMAMNDMKSEFYWSDLAGGLFRFDLNSREQQTITTVSGGYFLHLAVDPYGDFIYFDDVANRAIARIRPNGNRYGQVIPPDVAWGPALDIAGGKIYWASSGPTALKRANMDAGNEETLIANFNATSPTTRFLYIYTDAQLPPTSTPTPTSTATATSTPTVTPTSTITPTPLPTPTPGGPPAAQTIYWSNYGGDLLRAPVTGCADGACIETIVTPSPGASVGDLDIDSIHARIYWINPTDKSIQSSDMDGQDVQTILTGLTDPKGIAVDPANERIYWTDYSEGRIERVTFDGTLRETVATGLNNPLWIDLDLGNRHAYFAESYQDFANLRRSKIRRVSLDGQPDVVDLLVWDANPTSENVIEPHITGLAVDEAMERIYWSDNDLTTGAHYIHWVQMDGSGPTRIAGLDQDDRYWNGVVYDRNAFRLYWGAGARSNYFEPYSLPPYAIYEGFADGVISGRAITTTINIIPTQTVQAPLHLALAYPTPTPAACAADAYEPDDNVATATAVSIDKPGLFHNFHVASDEDWYRLELAAGAAYTVRALVTGAEADTRLELYAADGTTLLALADDPADANSSLVFVASQGDVYYARVTNTASVLTNCDAGYGLRVDIHNPPAATPTVTPLPPDLVPPEVDSAITNLMDGELVSNLGQQIIEGTSFSNLNSISAITLTVDGQFIDQIAPAADGSWSSTAWSLAAEGVFELASLAADNAGNVQPEPHLIRVNVDLGPPSLTIARTVFTQTHTLADGVVRLSGAAADSNGVNRVEIRLADPANASQSASLDGAVWSYPWRPEVDPDGGSITAFIQAADRAGRTAAITETLLFDIIPPQIGAITVSRQTSPTPQVLVAGDTVNEANPTLFLTWPDASDGSGVAAYYAGFTTSPTSPALSALTRYNAAGSHAQVMGEAQIVYGHLIVIDNYGNRNATMIGPFFIDGPAAPDLITDPDRPGHALFDYTGWMESGGSQLAADREITRGPFAQASFGVVQKFFMTWDAAALRMAWSGADWETDGDLFIYLDTAPGGATALFDPYAGANIALPPNMAANFVIWVQDGRTASLLDGAFNQVAELSADFFRHDPAAQLTDLYLPFNLLGLSNASSLRVLAVASEENDLRLWAAAPDHNPLNSERVINPIAIGRDLNDYGLTLKHEWPSLSLGQVPNAGRFENSDLQISIESAFDSASAGFLESDLLDVLTPGAPLDASALPGDAEPAMVGRGQTLHYTLRYVNDGPAPATNVRVGLNGVGMDVSANPSIHLGDIGPGEKGEVSFTANVDIGADRVAELQAVVGDGPHGEYDYFWFQNQVDATPPDSLQIIRPEKYARPGMQTVSGLVQDASAAPRLTVRVQLQPGGATYDTPCDDPTPTDGLWACQVDFGDLTGVDSVLVSAQARDVFGNESGFSEPVSLIVDLTPPAIMLSTETEAALADGFINADESLLDGQVIDDNEARRVEICIESNGGVSCETNDVAPGDAPAGDWSRALLVADADGVVTSMSFAGIDAAGNVSAPITRTFQIDAVGPVITATQLISVTTAPLDGIPVLAGHVSDGGGVASVYARIETSAGNVTFEELSLSGNEWSFVPDLFFAGTYTLTIEAYDHAGNGGGTSAFTLALTGGGPIIKTFLPLILQRRSGALPDKTFLPMLLKERFAVSGLPFRWVALLDPAARLSVRNLKGAF